MNPDFIEKLAKDLLQIFEIDDKLFLMKQSK